MKRVAYGLLAIPMGFLLLFTLGEVFSGDLSGLSHLLQITPIVFLLILTLKKPLIGGLLVTVISLILGFFYIVRNPSHFGAIILVESLLFIPMFVSGLLFIATSKK